MAKELIEQNYVFKSDLLYIEVNKNKTHIMRKSTGKLIGIYNKEGEGRNDVTKDYFNRSEGND